MSDALPVVYLARHGETAWTVSRQHTGVTDLPLTAPGEVEARQLGERLAGLTFAGVLTSPLRRAVRTCELGREVYGSMGIAREDKEGHQTAVLRNWEFFRAPLAGIVCMHRDLGPPDAVSVGMYLQTLLLALTERSLGTCVEVSIVGYPEIVRAQLAIPEELSLLCGLAVGYPDPEFPANTLHIRREAISKNVVFLDS